MEKKCGIKKTKHPGNETLYEYSACIVSFRVGLTGMLGGAIQVIVSDFNTEYDRNDVSLRIDLENRFAPLGV